MNQNRSRILPVVLLTLYLIEFSVLAIRPYDRGVWIAENTPIIFIVVFLVVTYRWFRFSNLAYGLMSALLFLHTIGGHYSFQLLFDKEIKDGPDQGTLQIYTVDSSGAENNVASVRAMKWITRQ